MGTKINGIEIYDNVGCTQSELEKYIQRVSNETPGDLTEVTLDPEGDDKIRIHYVANGVKFERIRRITGYLVGTMDRWNSAKQAEERERVKHIGETARS